MMPCGRHVTDLFPERLYVSRCKFNVRTAKLEVQRPMTGWVGP